MPRGKKLVHWLLPLVPPHGVPVVWAGLRRSESPPPHRGFLSSQGWETVPHSSIVHSSDRVETERSRTCVRSRSAMSVGDLATLLRLLMLLWGMWESQARARPNLITSIHCTWDPTSSIWCKPVMFRDFVDGWCCLDDRILPASLANWPHRSVVEGFGSSHLSYGR